MTKLFKILLTSLFSQFYGIVQLACISADARVVDVVAGVITRGLALRVQVEVEIVVESVIFNVQGELTGFNRK